MRNALLALFCALLAACAAPRAVVGPADALFDDALFGPPSERIGSEDVFALSAPMREYLKRPDVAAQLARKGPQRGLLEALYQSDGLKLYYDASATRNAAQAFDTRAGNCLSLVIMTAAFARELGIPVRFQSAYLEETISRSDNLVLRSGHVNVTLGKRFTDARFTENQPLTVDFLPPEEVRGLRTREIGEETVLAMFLNNRAVEALIDGRIDDAYAWAREAVRQRPEFLPALNTLGVVYLRRDALPLAAAVFDRVLQSDPANRAALANLAGTYARQGRHADSLRLQGELARLEPVPPLHYYRLGLAAMKRQDFAAARDLLSLEVAREGDSSAVHYWLGVANLELGDAEQAQAHFARALKASASPGERSQYVAKLEALKSSARR